ncbi:MAG: LpxL/LpxP family Kdo(2)-lipid IV(A) lauroyl/palmitoleoyl acyltransferase [Xanthomonadales bacterium]|nr:LpxL/LpxP family Kdo(2)-lipid IV(A) lauroyl/palmitoleoyl acyltransferase [Xanthomonadales bacterium]
MTSPATSPPTFHSPRHWPARLGVALMTAMARLPWPWQRRIGRALGWMLAWLAGPRRRVAKRNIALCFPQMSAAQQAELLRESFADLGIGLFEFSRAWFGDVDALAVDVQIEGLQHLQALQAAKRGVLLVSGHFTTLEVCGRLLTRHVPVAGMYRAHAEPAFEAAVLAGRLKYACAMFKREELRGAIRHLKQGGVLWYAPDQDMRGKEAVFVPFFDIPASTITATHQLARLSGAAVVPFFHRREGGRYVLRIGAPLENFPSTDVVADTAAVSREIETMVREAPSQYLWIHKRFKTRPDGQARVY